MLGHDVPMAVALVDVINPTVQSLGDAFAVEHGASLAKAHCTAHDGLRDLGHVDNDRVRRVRVRLCRVGILCGVDRQITCQ